jgi:hypothetical protein
MGIKKEKQMQDNISSGESLPYEERLSNLNINYVVRYTNGFRMINILCTYDRHFVILSDKNDSSGKIIFIK